MILLNSLTFFAFAVSRTELLNSTHWRSEFFAREERIQWNYSCATIRIPHRQFLAKYFAVVESSLYGSQNISSKKKGRRHKKVCAIRREDTEASQESYSEGESGEEYVLFMKGHDNRKQVTINGQKIKMVADTGCRQNIISSQLYKEQFRRFPLERITKQFVAYGQKIPLTCLGRFKAKLKAGMTAFNSYVYVIEGEAESLLGRKSCFDLEILKPVKSVKQVELSCGKVSDTRLNSLLKE